MLLIALRRMLSICIPTASSAYEATDKSRTCVTVSAEANRLLKCWAYSVATLEASEKSVANKILSRVSPTGSSMTGTEHLASCEPGVTAQVNWQPGISSLQKKIECRAKSGRTHSAPTH